MSLTISSLSVSEGYALDPLTITGTEFTDNTIVHFVIGSNLDVTVTSRLQSNRELLTTVPDGPGCQDYNGFAYLQHGNDKSNSEPFLWKPTPPAISALSVSEGYGMDPIGIMGAGFKATAEVHFIMGPNVGVRALYVHRMSDTQIEARVPVDVHENFTPQEDDYNGAIYIKCGNLKSAQTLFLVKAPRFKKGGPVGPLTIASLSPSEGYPGDLIQITGSSGRGFNGYEEVHFIIGPNLNVKASSRLHSNTQIMATVPDGPGNEEFNGMVYLQRSLSTGNEKSYLYPFRWKPTPLTLVSLNVDEGEPLTIFEITGTGFNAATEVRFRYNPDKEVKANLVGMQSSTRLYARVPLVVGTDHVGTVYLQRSKDRSNEAQFHFKPFLDVRPLWVLDEDFDVAPNPIEGRRSNYGWGPMGSVKENTVATEGADFQANHSAQQNWVFDETGMDTVFPNKKLKNGWVLHSWDFRREVSAEGEAGSFIVEANKGSDSPTIKIRWWATPNDWVTYYLRVYIKGPRGMPWE